MIINKLINVFRNAYYEAVGSENSKTTTSIKDNKFSEIISGQYTMINNVILFSVLLVIPIALYINVFSGLNFNTASEYVFVEFMILTLLLFLLIFSYNNIHYNIKIDTISTTDSIFRDNIDFKKFTILPSYFFFAGSILFNFSYDLQLLLIFIASLSLYIIVFLAPFASHRITTEHIFYTIVAVGLIEIVFYCTNLINKESNLVVFSIFYFYFMANIILLYINVFYYSAKKAILFGTARVDHNKKTTDMKYSKKNRNNATGF